MLNSEDLARMQAMADAATASVQANKKLFDATFESVMANAPAQHRGILEKVQANTKLAMELSKQGKQIEATEILNNLQNECKNIKT